jgi:hypothetical protein
MTEVRSEHCEHKPIPLSPVHEASFRLCAIRAPLVPQYLLVRVVWYSKKELLITQVLLATGNLATETLVVVLRGGLREVSGGGGSERGVWIREEVAVQGFSAPGIGEAVN